MLSRICSVDQADWERAMQTLLSGRKIGKDGEIVLALCIEALKQWGRNTITTAQWLSLIEQWGRGTGRSDEEIGELQAIALG